MTRLLPVLQSFSSRAATVATPATVLARSGIVRPYSPRTIARLGLELRRWGTGPAGGWAARVASSASTAALGRTLAQAGAG